MQNIGGISYTVDANISGLLKFDKQIDTTERNAVQSFGAIDKAAAQTGQQLNKVAAATQEATGGMNSLRGVAGNLGFQLQDIAVQAQAGTSAFTILGQQGSQIASAFGPGGAVLGAFIAVAAAVGGVFFTSLTDSTTAAEKLETAMKELAKTVDQSDEGVTVLTEELAKLAKASDQAANAQIRAALVQSEQAIRASSVAMGELVEKFSSAPDFIYDIQDALSSIERVGATESVLKLARGIGRDFGYAGEEAQKAGFTIINSLAKIQKSRSPEEISRLRDELLKVVEGAKLSKTQIAELVTGLNDLAQKSIRAAESAQLLTKAQGKSAESIATMTEAGGEAANKVAELVTALQRQSDVIGLTERGIALYTAESMGATKADLARINAIYDVTEAKQAQLKAERDFAKEMADLQKEIADDERQQAQEQFQMQQQRRSAFEGVNRAVTQELESPAERARRELSERLRVIQEYYQLESAEKAKATAEGIKAEQAYQKRLTEIRRAEEQNRLGFNNVTLSATADLFGNLAQMAEQGGKDSFNSWKLFASAQAAVNAALAITNALATVPPPLNFAVAGTVAAMTAAQIARINSMSYGGGRLYGGPVQAGTMYPVTENGKPELLVQGNRQYLLPGAGGRVVSNKDMQAGGGGVTIYLNPSTTINAIDTQSAAQFIAQNAEAISVAVDKQMQKYGRSNRR